MAKIRTRKFNLKINIKITLTLIITFLILGLIYYKSNLLNYISKHHIYKQTIINKIDDKDLNSFANFNFIEQEPHLWYDSTFAKNKFGIIPIWLKIEDKDLFLKDGKDYQFSLTHFNFDCESKKLNIDFSVDYYYYDHYPVISYDKVDDEYTNTPVSLEYFCNKK